MIKQVINFDGSKGKLKKAAQIKLYGNKTSHHDPMDQLLTRRNTVIFVGVVALWRLYLSGQLQLHPDEAYYWLWAQRLDFSYFDHPPMVAYFIWLTTRFSDAELWVRFSGSLVTLAISVLIWRMALQISASVRVAAGSVMLFNAYPLTMLGLMAMTPDVPLFLFWALGIFIFLQIVQGGKVWLWYALGLVFGLAMLSKYTAVLMLGCIALYLVLTPHRRWLKTVHPYLGLLISLICFLPVLYWNSRHDWVSFRFQFNNGLGAHVYSFGNVGEYLAGQAILIGPIVWIVGIYAGLAGIFRRDRDALLLICTTFPVIGLFAVSSLGKVAGANWPAFAYVAFSIMVARYCLGGVSVVRRSVWSAAVVTSLAVSLTFTLHAQFNVLQLNRFAPRLAQTDATNWFHGWRELGEEIKKRHTGEAVVTPSHQLSAQIIYYTQRQVPAYPAAFARPSQFTIWGVPAAAHRSDEIQYVWTEADRNEPHIIDLAAKSNPETFGTLRDGFVVRNYYVLRQRKLPQQPSQPSQYSSHSPQKTP